MNRRDFLTMGAVSATLAACSSAPQQMANSVTSAVTGTSDALLAAMSHQIGVSETQAAGGIGSIMSLAKSRLPEESFAKLSKGLPNVDKYMKTVQDVLGPNAKVTDLASLKSAFSRFGMGPEMIAKFKPFVMDALTKAGGDPLMQLLGGVL
ncbi:MAG: DUF2780 domain-containing protein [Burkholderiales bacterium]|nr:DUF2780 domain-containing protein [Burkholderiales bacterium]